MANHGIITYPDAQAVTKQLDELIKKPMYSISPEALKDYEENYFEKKCQKSKVMIEEAKQVIPGGVQHNLAFNYPFPLVFTKAEGAYLYDIDGNRYFDFLQQAAPPFWAAIPLQSVKRLLSFSTPADLQQDFSMNMNINSARRLPTLSPMLICSVCSARAPRLA